MLPFIIGGSESVVLQTYSQPKKGDVVLAWVDEGHYVVHRIISIEGDSVILMGDGNLKGTEHCSTADIKAVVTHVVDASGRKHELYCAWRQYASHLWQWLLPVRRYLLFIYRIIMRIKI